MGDGGSAPRFGQTAPILWIVCPSYSDVPAFTILRSRVLELTGSDPLFADYATRFLFVDDTAGADRQIEDVRSMEDVRVVSLPFNVGHQRAIVYGLRMVQADLGDSDLVVTMDGDGEDRPEDLPRMVAPLLQADSDTRCLCVARRTKRSESVRFQVMYFFFKILFRFLTGVTVRSGNYAAYRGKLARSMLFHPSFDLCYSSTLVSLDVEVIPVPCARGVRYAGRSKMNLLRLFTHGVRMLLPFTDRIAVRALSAFTAVFATGILLSVVVVSLKVFTTAAIPGWTTTTLLGILVLSFVALGNFIVLFAVFAQSRGISLAGMEEWSDRSA